MTVMTTTEPLSTLDTAVRARVGITLERAAGVRAELVTFHGLPDGCEHVACVLPTPGTAANGASKEPASEMIAPLVRLHSECLTGDVFGSARCDCGPQLDEALERMAAEGGVVLYLRQEGRGIGLFNKLDTYLLQDQDIDTFEANRQIGRGADERDYTAAVAMLRALGLTRIRLLTNNPDKVDQLRALGIEVDEVVPTGVHLTAENARYLEAKARLGNHTLTDTPLTDASKWNLEDQQWS
ncbi:GTP cyclohydrolase II [Kitasatospora sp. GP82]|uniref:GTP cyclohydrolase II n=1 Tax=Kitasatospora sp. GP82 TaxID=3035089 RepID=UPI002475D380|nr:GTP cyclohydrolase II [Kitasatospora sp. GP82]MDH6129698.1 GTP cyclohydrolase II [Kitasatospora sp. GP82]